MRAGDLVALLERLVGVESHASQPDGVRAVAEIVSEQLALAGFEVETVVPPPVPAHDRWLESIMLPELGYADIAKVMVARRNGDGAGRVLLLGDLDTSFRSGSLETFPFRLHGGLAYGPGVADMKGGLVVLAAAARALHETGLAAPSLTVVLSPDEQAGSLRSRPVIESQARGCAWCLCLECARDGGNLMGARSQCGVGLLHVRGREAHAGSAHGAGANAIDTLARKVPEMDALTDPDLGRYVTVTLVHGGRRRSVIPGDCTAVLDVRTRDDGDWNAVEAELQVIARREEMAGTASSLKLHAHRPAVPWTPGTDRLIEFVAEAGNALGIHPGVVRSGAGGSSAFAAPLGVAVLDGMGPAGGALMTDHEHIEVASLAERASLLALTLHLMSGAS